jgi:hypothetical protein
VICHNCGASSSNLIRTDRDRARDYSRALIAINDLCRYAPRRAQALGPGLIPAVIHSALSGDEHNLDDAIRQIENLIEGEK